MKNAIRQPLAIWLELRFWDLVMWLDAQLQGHPAWRAFLFHTLEDFRALRMEHLLLACLAGGVGLAGGVMLGRLIF